MSAPNISLLGATYPTVAGVTLPKSGGGTATFPWVEGSQTITTNGTVDVTSLAEVIVNVSGGGGSNWTLLASKEFSVNTTSTSNASVGSISLADFTFDKNDLLWVHVRDKAGKRNGYVYGSDTVFIHFQLANNNTNSLSIRPVMVLYVSSSGTYGGAASGYGVYAYRCFYTGDNKGVEIYRRYSSSYGTINGTFKCDVYKLTTPTGFTMFT